MVTIHKMSASNSDEDLLPLQPNRYRIQEKLDEENFENFEKELTVIARVKELREKEEREKRKQEKLAKKNRKKLKKEEKRRKKAQKEKDCKKNTSASSASSQSSDEGDQKKREIASVDASEPRYDDEDEGLMMAGPELPPAPQEEPELKREEWMLAPPKSLFHREHEIAEKEKLLAEKKSLEESLKPGLNRMPKSVSDLKRLHEGNEMMNSNKFARRDDDKGYRGERDNRNYSRDRRDNTDRYDRDRNDRSERRDYDSRDRRQERDGGRYDPRDRCDDRDRDRNDRDGNRDRDQRQSRR